MRIKIIFWLMFVCQPVALLASGKLEFWDIMLCRMVEEGVSDSPVISAANTLFEESKSLSSGATEYQLHAMGAMTNLKEPNLLRAKEIAEFILGSEQATDAQKQEAQDCLTEIKKRQPNLFQEQIHEVIEEPGFLQRILPQTLRK